MLLLMFILGSILGLFIAIKLISFWSLFNWGWELDSIGISSFMGDSSFIGSWGIAFGSSGFSNWSILFSINELYNSSNESLSTSSPFNPFANSS